MVMGVPKIELAPQFFIETYPQPYPQPVYKPVDSSQRGRARHPGLLNLRRAGPILPQ
jgi:hypothetical protein